jgi:hypothetical protein
MPLFYTFRSASVVAEGVVVKMTPLVSSNPNAIPEAALTFRVTETFKGSAKGTVMILTSVGMDCSPHFKDGERWILYIHADDNNKFTFFECGNSALSTKDEIAKHRRFAAELKKK